MSAEPILVVIVGPTASGKTALSLGIAEQFGGEIVSCDSVAVYRELEIGTAKPTTAERQFVRHHLIDIAAPSEDFTAGDYSRLARKMIAEIHSRGCLPIIVGGTGLYLRALLEGLLRERLGVTEYHREIKPVLSRPAEPDILDRFAGYQGVVNGLAK